eukprot:NODE_109_length_18665_cov_0.924486.p7 type:complete len:340 gc:universal NODE_109_length_18665_cov_0.924486:8138-9157(+)
MIIRVRTANGQFRFEISNGIEELAQLINQELKYSTFTLSLDPKGRQPVGQLQHGMQVYLQSEIEILSTSKKETPKTTLEDKIPQLSALDQMLWKSDGEVARSISTMCRHGDKGKCSYCSSLAPYDAEYLSSQNIKHLSFHSYLKKLKADKPDFLNFILEEDEIKAGITTKNASTSTLSSTVTLQRQKFRMVDHLEFETHDMVDKFLKSWRSTGSQRLGWLIGYYGAYDQVPLGIKTVVCTIYEPSQHGFVDGVQVYYFPGLSSSTDEFKHAKLEFDQLRNVCELLGLEIVVIIYAGGTYNDRFERRRNIAGQSFAQKTPRYIFFVIPGMSSRGHASERI